MIPPAPDLPRDPAAYRPRPRSGVGPGGFAAFGVICVLAGAEAPPCWRPAASGEAQARRAVREPGRGGADRGCHRWPSRRRPAARR